MNKNANKERKGSEEVYSVLNGVRSVLTESPERKFKEAGKGVCEQV